MRSIILPALLLAGCASVDGEADAPPVHGGGACDAGGVQSFIGQPATADLAAQAMDKASAKSVRWLRPGMAVTMDYRADRLNIEIDAANRVTAVRCG